MTDDNVEENPQVSMGALDPSISGWAYCQPGDQ